MSLSRRRLLQFTAASVGTARLAFAAAPARGDQRLAVVMLRGALDGLAAVPAVGDPAWAALRPAAAADASPLPLDGPFALHPRLAQLHRWYGEGTLRIVHAVASPYRERSHFDAQQLLESGGARPFELSTGWLGRALQAAGGRGVALSPALPLALRGAAGASSWAPTRETPADDDLLARIGQLYDADPQLGPMFRQALEQRSGSMAPAAGGAGFVALATQAGRFLAAPDGPAVAWLDTSGWDTHTQQAPRLARLLGSLDDGLAALRAALGERWATTTVLVMTEFGRSAVLNGSQGSDHGTGGVAFVAGGQVAGGRVQADWPGLARPRLLDGRDLRPTLDLRALIGPVLQRQFGLSSARLAQDVLPGTPPASLFATDLWRA